MNRRRLLILVLILFSSATQVCADEKHDERFMRKFEASLDYKNGTVSISENRATLRLMDGYRFLDSRDAKKILLGLWGQPSPKNTDGIILAPGIGPFSDDTWAFGLSFDATGHIIDIGDTGIDSEVIMAKLKNNLVNENRKRQNEDLQTIEILDWEIKPIYDKTHRCLYWAIKYSFSNEIQNEIIYNIKMLGRNGVLSISTQVREKLSDQLNNHMKNVIRFAEFNPGQEYDAFDGKKETPSESKLSDLITGAKAKEETLQEKITNGLASYRRFLILIIFASLYLITKHFRSSKSSS